MTEVRVPLPGPAYRPPPAASFSGHLTRALVARAVITAAAGVGLMVGTGSAAWHGLEHQARLATERIGVPTAPPPRRDGVYLPNGSFRRAEAVPRQLSRLRLAMLGDSSSAGFGAADADSVPGVMLARTLAEQLYLPVQLFTHAVTGAGAADLPRQADEALMDDPDVVAIIVGPNDVRGRVSPEQSVRELAAVVAHLRAQDIEVVVGTCPDLGVITPIPAPLRQLAGHWSRSLAARQERAVRRAGGLAVPMGRLVSPGFVGHPELFAPDRFHPSGAGYARAVAVLAPAVLTVLGVGREPGARRPELSPGGSRADGRACG